MVGHMALSSREFAVGGDVTDPRVLYKRGVTHLVS